MAAAFATRMSHSTQIEPAKPHHHNLISEPPIVKATPTASSLKTLDAGVGRDELRIPRTRGYPEENGEPFYPKAWYRCGRSDRAVVLAMTKMFGFIRRWKTQNRQG